IATEFHKAHTPLFTPGFGEATVEIYTKKIQAAYSYLSEKLNHKPYLLGKQFTVADAYAFTVINWYNFVNIDLSPWPILVDYQKRIAARPAVQMAMKIEGLLEKE